MAFNFWKLVGGKYFKPHSIHEQRCEAPFLTFLEEAFYLELNAKTPP